MQIFAETRLGKITQAAAINAIVINMAHGEIIDLLSSDEDTIINRGGATGLRPDSPNTFTSVKGGSDRIIHVDGGWATASAKRRRLSPPSKTSKESTEPPPPSQRRIEYNPTTFGTDRLPEDAWANLDEDDPIVFTSSAHPSNTVSLSVAESRKEDHLKGDESDDSLPKDILQPAPRRSNKANISAKTAAFIASLNVANSRPKATNRRNKLGEKISTEERIWLQGGSNGASLSEDGITSTPADHVKPKRRKLTEEERMARATEKEKVKEAKALQRELSREEKAKEREEDKERKRLLREKKAKDKQDAAAVADVNRSKIDKKDSTPEMIVDLPASFDGSGLYEKTREFMKNLNVDTTLYQSSMANVVKWRRKTKARWNADAEHWEPLERMAILDEKHILCFMSAKEFASLAMATHDDEDVQTHVTKLKSAYIDCIPIYLIEGLQALLNKSKTTVNRAYRAQVLALAQDQTERQPSGQRKRPLPELVDEDKVDDALLHMQVIDECLVHHTSDAGESAEWIANFTQQISTIPYR